MPNIVIFNIGGDTVSVDREFLAKWYTEKNFYDYSYDMLKYELSKTTIRDLAELYIENELCQDGLAVNYELYRDPSDIDIAENLMVEIRYLCKELRWMLPPEEISSFLEELRNC